MKITFTPWGAPESVKPWGPGIWLVETASHGGFYLEPAALRQVPLDWRKRRFGVAASSDSPWFEEDCDWAMVAVIFPTLFEPDNVKIARLILDLRFAKEAA